MAKNFVIYLDTKQKEVMNEKFEESDLSYQKFYTLAAMKALALDFEEVAKATDYPKIQFRLDNTIHGLLKEKSTKLGLSITDMIVEASKEL